MIIENEREVNEMNYITIGTGIYSTKNIQAFRSYSGTVAISYENGKEYLISVSDKYRKEIEEIFKNLLTNEK
jgi:hypothetical protein